jgi:hypothetical protein
MISLVSTARLCNNRRSLEALRMSWVSCSLEEGLWDHDTVDSFILLVGGPFQLLILTPCSWGFFF